MCSWGWTTPNVSADVPLFFFGSMIDDRCANNQRTEIFYCYLHRYLPPVADSERTRCERSSAARHKDRVISMAGDVETGRCCGNNCLCNTCACCLDCTSKTLCIVLLLLLIAIGVIVVVVYFTALD